MSWHQSYLSINHPRFLDIEAIKDRTDVTFATGHGSHAVRPTFLMAFSDAISTSSTIWRAQFLIPSLVLLLGGSSLPPLRLSYAT